MGGPTRHRTSTGRLFTLAGLALVLLAAGRALAQEEPSAGGGGDASGAIDAGGIDAGGAARAGDSSGNPPVAPQQPLPFLTGTALAAAVGILPASTTPGNVTTVPQEGTGERQGGGRARGRGRATAGRLC
jgi:hypothetical protein